MKFTRGHALALALLVTLGLVVWTASRDVPDTPAVAEAITKPHPQSSPDSSARTEPLAPNTNRSSTESAMPSWPRDPLIEAQTDPFKVVSFQPPAPKVVVKPPPPPKPVAPPFPYQYFGRMADVEGKLVTYLSRSDALIPIKEKEILDNTYRVDMLTESQIVVTYLPLNEKAVITIQSAAN